MHSTFFIKSFASSDKGLVRDNNEDVVKMLKGHDFFILADGMGGHQAGEVAAFEACEYMCHLIKSLPLENLSSKDIPLLEKKVISLMEKTNLWVHHLSKQSPHLYGMGTTLCSLLFFKNFMISSHVGDSRIYRFRENKLTRITKDHLTYKNNQNSKKNISKKFALTQAIGTSLKIKPSLLTSETNEEDLFLMCSDGLSDLVSDIEIEKTLQDQTCLQESSNYLTDLAKQRGGHDNISLLLTKLEKKET